MKTFVILALVGAVAAYPHPQYYGAYPGAAYGANQYGVGANQLNAAQGSNLNAMG